MICKQMQVNYAPIIVQRPKVPQAQVLTSETKSDKSKNKKNANTNDTSQVEFIPTISFAQNDKNRLQQQHSTTISSNDQDLGTISVK